MSFFYVGQRVRIVGARAYLHLVGCEATVTGRHECPIHGDGWRVSVDGIGESRDDGFFHWFWGENLEPIIPPGLESLEEINTLYEPEVVTVEKRA